METVVKTTPIPIVALDVGSAEAALSIVHHLGDYCRFYKIGSELFTACGPQVVREVRAQGADVFLDLKFHDIPNTVAGAVRSAASLGVRLMTVHAAGGAAMLRAAATAARDAGDCRILAVTLLTSLTDTDVASVWGRDIGLRVADEVERLAQLAQENGAAGIVCSGREASAVKGRFGSSLAVLIPGIRLPGGAPHDQSRPATPAEAAATGADFVVVGRAVTSAADPAGAMREISAQLR
jgi:orotidine-5'-phosphate decarboxylase